MNDDILRLYLEGMDELLNEAYQLEEEFKRRIVKLETLFLQENAHRARHQSRYYHSFGNLKMWVEANEDIANADLWQKELNGLLGSLFRVGTDDPRHRHDLVSRHPKHATSALSLATDWVSSRQGFFEILLYLSRERSLR